MTLPQMGNNSFRSYVLGFSMPLNGRKHPYGMPTSTMTSLHNTTSTFTKHVGNTPLPLQGSNLAINNMVRISQPLGMGFTIQTSNLTNHYAAVIRQQIDESNHEIVQMLANQMNTIFNPLIQNTTQTNKQIAAQMTHIVDFFGVPQPPRHPQREWMIENQGVALEEDPTINQVQQNQRNIPQTNVVNQGV